MKKTSLESFGDLKNAYMFHVLETGIAEMRKVQKQVVQVEYNGLVENNTINLDIIESKDKVAKTRIDHEERIKSMIKEATHLILAKSYYIEQVGKKTKIAFPIDTSIDIEED
jgi:hypothetical protein